MTENKDSAAVIATERAALDRWGRGDPSGFLEICAPDVAYFDDTLEERLDGLEALTRLYEAVRGKIHLDRYELINPKVQLCGDGAVLTYNFVGHAGGQAHRWNCTEVYRQSSDGWRILHTHWSFTQPFHE
jgi:ketosteroid isomerase-like protein